MARTDLVAAELVHWMDRAFNDADMPPVGGLSGGAQLRPGLGIPALDNFDDCTLVWVTAGARGKTESFPTMSGSARCGGVPLWEFSVGVARCSIALGVNGELPSLEEMEQEYAIQEDDKDRIEWATCNAMKRLEADTRILNYDLSPLDVYGPEGATVAVYRSILVSPQGRGKA